jgi:hypothetical protein
MAMMLSFDQVISKSTIMLAGANIQVVNFLEDGRHAC